LRAQLVAQIAMQDTSLVSNLIGLPILDGLLIQNGGVLVSQNNDAANVTPTATFADGKQCGMGGSIAGTTLAFTVKMGTTNPTTVCPITFGTDARCPNGSRCIVSPARSAGNPNQVIIAAGTTSGVTLTAQTDMHSNVENVQCTCF
jgi:hypothetical protein